jgi:(p)ppGpp synthase/HD superfamily hydrolase
VSTLEKAIRVATKAHSGQFDKASMPYILHPLRVMMAVDSVEEKIVAVLHDVLEDTYITEIHLYTYGFSENIINAIRSVTRNVGEDYFDFIRRAKQNEIGRKVKIADLKDNMDWSRISNPIKQDVERMKKYQQAYFILIQ